MGDTVTVDTGATDQVAAALHAAADRLGDPSGLLADLAGRVASDAGPRTPRATGALANSLTVKAGTREGKPAQLLTWGVRYAVFVNFGTRHMPARPFATDALTAATATADTALADWAGHIIDQIGP